MENEFDALSTLVTRCWENQKVDLRRLCRHWMGGNTADGDEAFSRIGLSISQKLPRDGRKIENPDAWVRRVAFNICMDLHRENQRRAELPLDCETRSEGLLYRAAAESDPETLLLDAELRQRLWDAIESLPDRLRVTLETHLEASSYREVAEKLSIREANARKRVQQARGLLRLKLRAAPNGPFTRRS